MSICENTLAIGGGETSVVALLSLDTKEYFWKHKVPTWTLGLLPQGQAVVGYPDYSLGIIELEQQLESVKSLDGHFGEVSSVAFSGQTLVSGSWDTTVRVWNTTTGDLIGKPFTKHQDWVNAVAVDSSGSVVASGGDGSEFHLWSIPEQEPLLHGVVVRNNDAITSLAFSANDEWIAVGYRSGHLTVAKIGTTFVMGTQMHSNRQVTRLSWSPKSLKFVSVTSSDCFVWEIDPMKLEINFVGELHDHRFPNVAAVLWSLNDDSIVTGSSNPGRIVQWNATSLNALSGSTQLQHDDVQHLQFVPGTESHQLRSASVSTDVKVWEKTNKTWKLALTKTVAVGHSRAITSIGVSGNGNYVFSTSLDESIRIWDTFNGSQVGILVETEYQSGVTTLVVSKDMDCLFVGDVTGRVNLWNYSNQTMLNTIQVSQSSITALALSPDGNVLVAGSADGALSFWNTETGISDMANTIQLNGRVHSIDWNPAGNSFASSSDDGIIVWNVSAVSNTTQPRLHVSELASLIGPARAAALDIAYSPLSHVLAAGYDDASVTLWNLISFEEFGQPVPVDFDPVTSVMFTSNGSKFISADMFDSVHVFDTLTLEEVNVVEGIGASHLQVLTMHHNSHCIPPPPQGNQSVIILHPNSTAPVTAENDNTTVAPFDKGTDVALEHHGKFSLLLVPMIVSLVACVFFVYHWQQRRIEKPDCHDDEVSEPAISCAIEECETEIVLT